MNCLHYNFWFSKKCISVIINEVEINVLGLYSIEFLEGQIEFPCNTHSCLSKINDLFLRLGSTFVATKSLG